MRSDSGVRKGKPADVLNAAFELTGRVPEVLTWIANGKSNKEIAVLLDRGQGP
ncbi:LuxR C-terminal-related transcriptional regulator [Roseibium aggregatum]|uniref:HTH luxR-type domain-containing protein n=1 Tax=Roseibium aggregatum TaxID=187304 RepID=A0A939EGB9_9HYPH|nr:LuxR C-terminal-related transcriptional regulator [Roseibium aggregatum]MBN9671962.1 hypothetical protein [Roseibium aggregatum]